MTRNKSIFGNSDNSVVVVNTVAVSGSTTLVGTGSTTVVGTVTVTGSTVIIGTVTVTGSTAVVGSVTVTGSTAIIGTVTVTGSTTGRVIFPSAGSISVNVTGATSNFIVIPSAATNSIYVTDLVISNGADAGNVMFAHTNTSTAGNVYIQPLYFTANTRESISLNNPMKITAVKDLVATTVSMSTVTILATYFVAP